MNQVHGLQSGDTVRDGEETRNSFMSNPDQNFALNSNGRASFEDDRGADPEKSAVVTSGAF
jgi:hypothetical protein